MRHCSEKAGHERHEKKGVSKLSADYANSTDFCAIFEEHMTSLYQLALLLTADQTKAEQCFASGLEDCQTGILVFRDWARLWAKRIIIKNAIALLTPRPSSKKRSPTQSPVAQPLGAERHSFSRSGNLARSNESCLSQPFSKNILCRIALSCWAVRNRMCSAHASARCSRFPCRRPLYFAVRLPLPQMQLRALASSSGRTGLRRRLPHRVTLQQR